MRHFLTASAVWIIALLTLLLPTSTMAGIGIRHDPPNIDRPGGDIQRIRLAQPDTELCVRACVSNSQCNAYTYVRPGVQEKQAVCYLKSSQRPIVRNNCCTSGIKIGVPDLPVRTKPPRVQTPDSGEAEWCNTGITCGSKKGHWNGVTGSCECGTLPRRDGPTDANGIPTTREAD